MIRCARLTDIIQDEKHSSTIAFGGFRSGEPYIEIGKQKMMLNPLENLYNAEWRKRGYYGDPYWYISEKRESKS